MIPITFKHYASDTDEFIVKHLVPSVPREGELVTFGLDSFVVIAVCYCFVPKEGTTPVNIVVRLRRVK